MRKKKNNFILSRDDPKTFILLEDTKNTGLLIFNSLKQYKLIFNFLVNSNWKKLTDSRKVCIPGGGLPYKTDGDARRLA